MTASARFRQAEFPRDRAAVEKLCWDYREDLLALEGDVGQVARMLFTRAAWQKMLDSLPDLHARPRGSVLLAEWDGEAVGCGMIHPLSSHDAEIKRVYVAPKARGTGLGEALTRELIQQSRDDGFQRILLDTTKASVPAARLYEKLGFTSRGPYTQMATETKDILIFFELTL